VRLSNASRQVALESYMAHTDLADWIESHKEDLTTRWAEAVRRDPRIKSDTDLSQEGLRDHIPAVIEEICEMLRSDEVPTTSNTKDGRVHAYVRYRQGYRARELVRELSLLRLTLLDHLAARLTSQPLSTTGESFIAAMRLIDSYIDEELSYAVSVYAEVIREQ
jgi:RsbT co-antagonist protein rsbRD N-terminal domain